MTDGGVAALSGFLYQLLGSVTDLSQAANDQLAVLFLECSGEDALLSLSSGNTFLQFKYSADAREIQPSELSAILSKLENHAAESSCAWKLCTNRPLSPAAKLFLPGALPNPQLLKMVDNNHRNLIQSLIDRLKIECLSLADLRSRLCDHGRLFGLTENEIQAGASRIVGAMMFLVRDQGPGAAVEHAFLNEKLVGFANPRSLKGSDRVPDVTARLEWLASEYLVGPSLDEAIPRKALTNLIRMPDEPIVLVTGPGGCGKSLSVLRAVRDHVIAQHSLGGMLFSDRAEKVEDLVSTWRSPLQNLPSDRLSLALQRLQIANAESDSWVLVLALDGLDEDGWRASHRADHIRELVSCVRESRSQSPLAPSFLKLIITCRDKREIDHLFAGSGVGGIPRTQPIEVPLEMFDADELREAWFNWFPKLPFPILPQTEPHRDRELVSDAGRAATYLDFRIAQALQQPTMLGCFKNLDEPQQRGLLAGDGPPWSALMRSYLNWFTQKVFARRRLAPHLTLGVLSACAEATSSEIDASHDRDLHWVRPAVDFSGGPRAEALHLFTDAVTCGLLETDAGAYRPPEGHPVRWRWRYTFVAEHLTTAGASNV